MSSQNNVLDIQNTILYKAFINKKYSDVILIASDGTKIPTHRCVLAAYSNYFADIFDSVKKLPVKIEMENFDSEIIKAAVNFMFYKQDTITGKELKLLEFARRFDIPDLTKAFTVSAETAPVTVENVIEYIQIAYMLEIDTFKKKCTKVLIEKKKEIDPSKLNDLPKNILVDLFRF